MLYTIALVLLVAWLLGLTGTYAVGAFVHLLLVLAVVLVLVGMLRGRRVLG
ncbi:MAG TPA: lmo0937 family membrane protein [Vicinamibacterales bacterium]|nr:lmo0937 family membrane protein [Vicinamibacterales bacterium]